MQIKLFRDLKKYTLTSSITKADIDLVKKYRPDALIKRDEEGNDVFGISYVEGKPSIAPFGVTFGSVSTEGGFAMITGDLPDTPPAGQDYPGFVADKVGAALAHISEFEATIPATVAAIQADRAALLEGIVEA